MATTLSSARNRIREAASKTGQWAPMDPNASDPGDSYRHRNGWTLSVEFTPHGEIDTASVGRWEPRGTPSEKLAAVLKVLTEVK